jgi:hypothetical protein
MITLDIRRTQGQNFRDARAGRLQYAAVHQRHARDILVPAVHRHVLLDTGDCCDRHEYPPRIDAIDALGDAKLDYLTVRPPVLTPLSIVQSCAASCESEKPNSRPACARNLMCCVNLSGCRPAPFDLYVQSAVSRDISAKVGAWRERATRRGRASPPGRRRDPPLRSIRTFRDSLRMPIIVL